MVGEDQRIRYSSYLELVISAGIKCVVIDLRLEETSPEAFRFLLSFACDNELQVRDARHEVRAQINFRTMPPELPIQNKRPAAALRASCFVLDADQAIALIAAASRLF